MLAAVARFSYRMRWLVLAGCVGLLPLAVVASASVFDELKPGGYEDPSTESFRARELIADRFGVSTPDIVALYSVDSGPVVDSAASPGIQASLEAASADPGVTSVDSFFNTGADQFLSSDGRRTFATLTLEGEEREKVETLERLRPLLATEGATTELGGEIPLFESLNETLESDLRRAERIAFPLLAILLLLIFRTVIAAVIPLILGTIVIAFALAVLRALTSVTDISVFALNVITILGLGLAVDYSLFILSRFREELQGASVEDALVTTVATTGKAVVFSGATLGASLVGLMVFPQLFLRSMAIGGIAVALLAIFLAVTVLPALIGVLGTRVNSLPVPFLRPQQDEEPGSPSSGFWHNLALMVMRRPGLIGACVVVGLLLLGIPFLRFQPAQQDERALDESFEPRRVSDIINADFLPNETKPHLIAVTGEGDLLTDESIADLAAYHEALEAVPGVTRVDSVISATGGGTLEETQVALRNAAEGNPGELAPLIDRFVAGNVARFTVISAFETFEPAGQEQVSDIRDIALAPGLTAQVGGNTADLYDVQRSLLSRLPFMLLIVAGATFVALFLVFGSITLPIKAMIMNAFSLAAAFGITVFIFQDGRLEGLLGYESLGTTDVTLPILMFAVLFGLSMDYEVLMLSRVREEYVRTGDNSLAVARGLEKTGRLITSAAALLIIVIAAFATSSLTLMKALGVGMALAIAIDASIVRALLVPASMRLMGDWNWWSPPPLVRLWERIGLGDLEGSLDAPEPVHPSKVVPALPSIRVAVAPAGAPPGEHTIVRGADLPANTSRTIVLPEHALLLAYLVNQEGDEEYPLAPGITTVGRRPGCDIVVSDTMVSGLHMTIERTPGGEFVIQDQGSTNGTFVDGTLITGPTSVNEDSNIAIGEQCFRIRMEREPEPAAGELEPAVPERVVEPTLVERALPEAFEYLIEVEGADAGAVFPLTGDTVALGRDPQNQVVIADPKVSAFHAYVQRGLDGGLIVEDRGSTNGTKVNDQQLTDVHRLEDDDLIQVGDTLLRFKRATSPDRLAT